MKSFFMHKNILVAELELDISNNIIGVKYIDSNTNHLPPGVTQDTGSLINWFSARAVPIYRDGCAGVLNILDAKSNINMLFAGMGISLCDCYWVDPCGGLSWEEVSLFRRKFVDAFGEMSFDTLCSVNIFNKDTWFITSGGKLRKKWVAGDDGNVYLVKGRSIRSSRQCLNEVFASTIHKLQGSPYPYVEYTLEPVSVAGGIIVGSMCRCFCNEEVEFVPAQDIIRSVSVEGSADLYSRLVYGCVEMGMNEEYVRDFLGYLIMTDFVMTNTDRGMDNLGVLRNPDTLEYIGMAPIFDTGDSMFYDCYDKRIDLLDIGVCSFLDHEVDMLQYVEDRSAVDIGKLPDYSTMYSVYGDCMIEYQVESIYNAYKEKVAMLKEFQSGVDIWKMRGRNKRYVSVVLR